MLQSYRVTLECIKTLNRLTIDIEQSSAYGAQKTAEELFEGFHAVVITNNQENN